VGAAIKNTEIEYTKTGNVKGIKGPLKEVPGFGAKFVIKNQEILYNEITTPKPTKKEKTLQNSL